MLCYDCSNIQFQWYEDIEDAVAYANDPTNKVFDRVNTYEHSSVEQKFFVHKPSLKALNRSKDDGCYICAALWFAFHESSPEQDAMNDPNAKQGNEYPVIWRVYASRREQFASDIWYELKGRVVAYCGSFSRDMYHVPAPSGKRS